MKLILLTLLVVSIVSLPYQAHGFNDLEYFIQLLKKGVRTFKMDLSLLSKKSCLEQSTWEETDNTCFTLPAYAQQLCCLGFRGDTSSTPEVRYQFNTTNQFLNVLARPDLQIILREKIFLAINFQYSNTQNQITKQFLYDVLSAIKLRNLSITLATGTDNIILDYDYKCLIQGKCDEKQKFISDSNIVLQSSAENPFHPHDVKKRYRNFNVFYKQVEHFCKQGFPSWVDKYDYPLIFWEPSSQQQIQFVLNTFLSSSCKRPAKHNTINELAIASNLQPEVFQVYALGKGVNYGVGQRIQIENAASPFLTTLEVNNVKHILIGYNDVNSKNWKIDLLNSSNPKQKVNSITFTDAALRNVKGHQDTFVTAIQFNNGSKVFRVYNSSLLQLGQFGAEDEFYPLTYYKQMTYYVSLSKKDSKYSSMAVDVIRKTATKLGCEIGFTPTDVTYLDTLYYVGSIDKSTYLNKNCTADIKLSYGTNTKVTSGDNQLYIFQANGMCQSAVLMNNNQMNKCNFWNDADFESLKNVPYMNTYIAGTAENIYKQQSKQNWTPISGCSQNVYSGKVGNGNNISPISLNGRLHFAYEYVPISQQPFITSVFCGGSNFDNKNTPSIVLSSFDTPPLTKSSENVVLLDQ